MGRPITVDTADLTTLDGVDADAADEMRDRANAAETMTDVEREYLRYATEHPDGR